jgi:uncharacterized RDD family membrane protein YckC
MSDNSGNWAPPTPAQAAQTNHPDLAGFWIRLLANICDGIMVGLVTLPFSIMMTATSGSTNTALGYLQFIVGFGVLAYWIGNQGGSPLRRKLGVFIIDENDGSFIGMQRAFTRIAMSWVSGICLLIGYLSMLWHPRRQTWHDRVAHSVVVLR